MFPQMDVRGTGIRLRKLEQRDLVRVTEWLNDPEVCKGLGREPGITRDQEEAWYRDVESDPTKLVFAVENNGGEHVGNIALNRIDRDNKHALLTLAFGRKYWGSGYAKESVLLLLNYAFNQLGMHKVYGRFYLDNEKSIGLFERIGFKKEGVLRDEILLKEGYRDVLVMSILDPNAKH